MRPRDLGIALVYLLILLACTAAILPIATTWVRSDADAIPGTLAWAGQLIGIYFVAAHTARAPRIAPLIVAILLNSFLMAVVAMSMPAWVLNGGQAEQFRATVVEVYDGHKGPATYTLAVDGVPIPGRLADWPGDGIGAIGDKVLVAQDEEGLLDPRLPEQMAEDVAADGTILILPTIAILAVLCLVAVWPGRRDRELRSRPPHEIGLR
ncbi:hypothetical protein [Actinoplanes regularis]|nr:hypothetical protein [Actinoplanes regularis]GIE88031.1 hypothetical protein Are01nite_45110 [Actinoplanes regularis]